MFKQVILLAVLASQACHVHTYRAPEYCDEYEYSEPVYYAHEYDDPVYYDQDSYGHSFFGVYYRVNVGNGSEPGHPRVREYYRARPRKR